MVGRSLVRGDVEVADGRIVAAGVAPAGRSGMALPGFIDLHVHGHAGIDFVDATTEQHINISRQLAATGVTSYHPTLMSLPIDQLLAAMGRRPTTNTGGARSMGFHLEGPFLSSAKSGAHRPDALVDPSSENVTRLLEAGLAHITLAPELPGALEAIETLVEHDVVVSLGHSVASAELTHAAIDRGARAFTHVFNAMEPLGHRNPGMVGVALSREDVYPTAIFDGVHLSDEASRILIVTAGERLVAITDGTAATNTPPGRVVLGDLEVQIVDGAPRLPDGTIAGSILTMDQALRNLIGLGMTVPAAAMAVSTAPARLARLGDRGELREGAPADIAVLDDNCAVVRTLVDGVEVFRT